MPAEIIDLFCGIGGLTRGLIDAGLNVVAGFDIDPTCKYTYEKNNHVTYHTQNIREVHAADLNKLYTAHATKILVGCAPCQPFSQMRFKLGDANQKDEKYNLLLEYARLIEEVRPEIISMENVPQIKDTKIYSRFLQTLKAVGYQYSEKVVYCPDYGIPQSRRRFVLIGSLLGSIKLIEPTHRRGNVNIKNFIGDLPQIEAGEADLADPLHCSASLSEVNLKRIKASHPGGTWHDWPEELRCPCHRRSSGETYSSVYGRMSWDKIGPTITTQFYCFGTGRFGHPEQNRALSLREGAMLQTFPRNYVFIDPNRKFNFRDIARHIGNAVPVRLGQVIGETILQHLKERSLQI